MKVIGLIPARYKSSRYPGKPLVSVMGKPLVIWVAEKTAIALGIQNTYVATDDEQIAKVVTQYGYQVVMTSSQALTGTDRLWEAAQQIEADIYVNVQGDEPLINPTDILDIIEVKKENYETVINGMFPLSPDEDPANVNIPKVVTNKNGDLIYMSRLPIPGFKSAKPTAPIYHKQVCIYAFNFNELKAYGEMNKKAAYEFYEDIEILRFFDLDIPIKMVTTSKVSLAVDVPSDVAKVEAAMKKEAKNIPAILFDFDGVILDSMSVRTLGFRTIFKDYPSPQVEELVAYHLSNGGLSRYVKIRHFFENIRKESITEEQVNEWAGAYSEIMRQTLIDPANLIADTVAFIKEKHRLHPLHIVSGSDHKELNFLCKELGIAHYFLSIHGSPTPKTKLVSNLLEYFGYTPTNCVLIGDSINDYDSAIANQVSFLGYNNRKLINHGEKYLNSMKEFEFPKKMKPVY